MLIIYNLSNCRDKVWVKIREAQISEKPSQNGFMSEPNFNIKYEKEAKDKLSHGLHRNINE